MAAGLAVERLLYYLPALGHYEGMARRRISISTAIRQRVPRGARVLVAVSGGRDSMVLLHAMLAERRLLKLEVEVSHIDHGLRTDSARDAEFVAEMCKVWNVPCHVRRLPEKPEGENTEAWGRTLRYRHFAQILSERNLDLLVTAHTANDVAETLLMRLLANKELNTIEEEDPVRRCVRPLLDISREHIDQYVEERALSYREDSSNADCSFVRNRIRQRVLPLLIEAFDPSMVWILAEQAQSIAQDCEALQNLAHDVAGRIGPFREGDPQWVRGLREALHGLDHAVRWRVVQYLWTPVLGFTVGRGKALAIVEIISGEGGKLSLNSSIALVCDKYGVRLEPC